MINKFDIRDKENLELVERQITALKIAKLEESSIKGNFNLKHLQSIHKFIFDDIYKWAGKIREGDFLIKSNSIFCKAMYIESMTEEIHDQLKADNFLQNLKKDKFINKLAFYMGEINAIHPFREGNGRTHRIYFKQLCKKAGYCLEFHKIEKEKLVKADILAFNKEYSMLIELLDRIVYKLQ